MSGLEELKVSLTKNGFFKVAEVIKKHPRLEVLDNIDGVYPGINLNRAQIARMLSADKVTDELPEVWDEVRKLGDTAVDALTFISVVYSHHSLIEALQKGKTAEMRGVLSRSSIGVKAYTNVTYSMETIGLCTLSRAAEDTFYDFSTLFQLEIGPLVKKIIRLKLEATGWEEPTSTDYFTRSFYEQCNSYGFPDVLGITPEQWEDWLEGRHVAKEAPPDVIVSEDEVEVSASLVSALGAKPFVVLSGTTGTGKTRRARQLVEALKPDGAPADFNHVFIPVEAGWTDGRHLFGYRNPFGQYGEHYASTKLVSLLLRANYEEYSHLPFFVVLDEMNLSYVEMYFSHVLSLMETRDSGTKEPVLTQDDLRLLGRSALTDAVEMTYVQKAIENGGLFLSDNVFMIGTVNIDETTHMFSPKVLDRAFVIEHSPLKPSETEAEFTLPEEDTLKGKSSDVTSFLTQTPNRTNATGLVDFLDEVQERMGRFAFGQRVTQETQKYAQSVTDLADACELNELFSSDESVRDRVLLQKILPKIHGNRAQLGKMLEELLAFAKTNNLPQSVGKLTGMAEELRAVGFTNYFSFQ